jgi:hypothetical protein
MFPAFLDTPGIVHAGNYTGKHLKPAPPVYDPRRLAQAMVELVKNPKENTYVGGTSFLLRLSNALFPELTPKLTGFVMRRYFNVADDIPATSGNLFNTVDYGMSSYGGFGLPGEPKAHRKYLAGVLLMGLAAGFYLVSAKK